jgi:hypothetical protein
MRSFGRVTRAKCLSISARLRRVASSPGIAAREMDRRQLDWHHCSIAVIATDASEKQIAKADPHECVEYRVAPAESSGIESETIDLMMVA